MSVERELLVEALEWMEELNYVWLNSRISGDSIALELIADINKVEQLLAQPEREPVAWIIQTEVEGKLLEWVCTDKKHYMEEHDSIKEPIPLYTAPPKREPLSEDTMLRLISEHRDFPLNLVRAIEKAHGIGGGA